MVGQTFRRLKPVSQFRVDKLGKRERYSQKMRYEPRVGTCVIIVRWNRDGTNREGSPQRGFECNQDFAPIGRRRSNAARNLGQQPRGFSSGIHNLVHLVNYQLWAINLDVVRTILGNALLAL